jgi:hypothetical protein
MALQSLNKAWMHLQVRMGLRANLEKQATVYDSIQGEPFYTTDGKQLFFSDGSTVQPIQSVDMLVTHDGDFVFHDGEPVIRF